MTACMRGSAFAWPEEPAHMPLSNEVTEIEPEIQNALTRIVNLPADEDGVFAPRTVDLSAEAISAFETFRTFLAQLKPELDGREREWVAKGGTHVLRLSGTLAYLDWAMLGGPEPQVHWRAIRRGGGAAVARLFLAAQSSGAPANWAD